MNQFTKQELGWQSFFEGQCTDTTYEVGRICLEHKHIYRIMCEDGEYVGELTGKFRHGVHLRSDYPTVGDWVFITKVPGEQKVMIHGLFERKSVFIRRSPGGKAEEQIVAANVDYVFLVNALNGDFNVRRLERYVLLAFESGATPIIVLTKKDLCDDVEVKIQEVEKVAFGIPVIAVNSLEDDGVAEVRKLLSLGVTVALLGSSGVGKSTLLNALIGEEIQHTSEVREGDDRGKHTTTHRELFILPTGGLVMDTPGMRELQLWDGDSSLSATFSDIDELATLCRFHDCKHETEPGCAVQESIESGQLEHGRLISYNKLQREIAYGLRKQKQALRKALNGKSKKPEKVQKKYKAY
ncbi:ribosome small subunit-dependent GTPase A [Priestia taiwanensis]|uniref:Small ribosomal subunit biogenesis GTPase RsgA n=1 Tax=Priestia taiwanensis TaxID=1347902 RepID=A0A917AK47_9BACI|nr:ribosome small subunit-dependent GTPase A [Priestia taiwanensis]MBM7361869.1 ribosome biogenesis GTPase [Priestia taiwanensis]GGE57566.1 putative ribosome biogenesis GTPase RsgA [Priestia taiwanensis]